MRLLRMNVPASLQIIKGAGFDGIECHLIGSLLSSEQVLRVRSQAADLGLGVRFHQGWSWDSGQRNLFNMLLRPTRSLIPNGTPFAEQMAPVGDDPVVVYGNNLKSWKRDNFIYQTAPEYFKGRVMAMSFDRFQSLAHEVSAPLAFDTQHVLEWAERVSTVDTLVPQKVEKVFHLWQELRPLVKEIHLNDFNPALGTSHGRNVFLGEGIFPLKRFCDAVSSSGWDGVVVPEVGPQHLRSPERLQQLRRKVSSLLQC